MDRKLIKSQAKALLRGNVWKLFLISLVTVLLVPLLQSAVTSYTVSQDIREVIADNENGFDFEGGEDAYDFYNFGNDDAFDPYYFEDFDGQITALNTADAYGVEEFDDYGYYDDGNFDDYGYLDDYGYYMDEYDDGYGLYPDDGYGMDDFYGQSVSPQSLLRTVVCSLLAMMLSFVAFILLPLRTTLAGYYVQTIRGRKPNTGNDIAYVYKTAFSTAYFKKLGLELLMNIAIGLATLCFIVPGIILSLHWAFARQILCDNPEMDIFDALRLSGQMTKGHKTELFKLYLSFIGWYLLGIITCGLVYIYVYPYFHTTLALYYQNFKIRALQTHAVDPAEFMSAAERAQQFATQVGAPWGAAANGYVPHEEAPNATQGYAPPQPNAAPGAQPNVTFTEAQYTQPQEPNYIHPEEPKDVFESAEEPQDVFEDAQNGAEGDLKPQTSSFTQDGENAVQASENGNSVSASEAPAAGSEPQTDSEAQTADDNPNKE